MGADAALVNAAYRMGMANVPGDYSASFNKQYEGIIAADKARAELFGTAVKTITGVMDGIVERKLKKDKDLDEAFGSDSPVKKTSEESDTGLPSLTDILNVSKGGEYKDVLNEEWKREINGGPENDVSSDYLKSVAQENESYYSEGNRMNLAFFDLAQQKPKAIYEKIKKLNQKAFPSSKTKQEIAQLYTDLETWKRDFIKLKGNLRGKLGLVNGNMANLNNMNPELKMLIAQIAEPNTDLAAQGIKLYNRDGDGEMMIKYTGNRMESKYQYNMRMAAERGDFIKPSEVTGDGPELEEGQTPYEEGKRTTGEVERTISLKELLNSVLPMQLEAENGVIGTLDLANTMAAERDPRSKTFKHNDNSAKREILRGFESQIKGNAVVADLSTRDILKTGTTYRQALGGLLANMDLENMLGVEDKGKKGFADDLQDYEFKKEVLNRLTNPQTVADTRIAEIQMTQYFGDIAYQQYSAKRKEILDQEEEAKDKSNAVNQRKANYGGYVLFKDTRVYRNHDMTLDKSSQLRDKPKGATVKMEDDDYTVVEPGRKYKGTDGKIYTIDQVWDSNSMPGALEWFNRDQVTTETSKENEELNNAIEENKGGLIESIKNIFTTKKVSEEQLSKEESNALKNPKITGSGKI